MLLLLALGCISFAADARGVKELKILQNSMTRGNNPSFPPDLCLEFKPTVVQMKRHLSDAYPVPDSIVFKDRYTPCYAEGTVVFSDGASGKWIIYSSGAGHLEFDLGGSASVFARGYKWNDPTACMYGDEGEKC